nr:histidine kinase [uncultured Marvinbryantia sp.]
MKHSDTISQTKIGRKLRDNIMRLIIAALFITAVPLIVLFSKSYLDNNISQKSVIADQITQQVDLAATSIIIYSKQVASDRVLLNFLASDMTDQNTAKIENRLMEMCGTGPNIKNIMLICEQGDFHTPFMSDEEMHAILDTDWVQNCRSGNYTQYFSSIDREENIFYFCTSLKYNSPSSGLVILVIRADDLMQTILGNANKTFSHYIWLDSNNQTFLEHSFEPKEDLYSRMAATKNYLFFDNYKFHNSDGIFLSSYSDTSHWKFAAFIPYSELLAPLLPLLLVLVVSVVLITVISVTALKPLIHNIVYPIKVLSEHMKNFSYDKVVPVDIHTNDEIEELSSAFHKMSVELKKNIDLLLEEQKKEQKLQYGLRISQINPHFIYNTMNTINYLARKDRTKDIVVINSALIHIMKDSLRINDEAVMDTLETEINITSEYLKIQAYRYEEKIHVYWEIDPALRGRHIPKHIIQPIVENSIVHGFLEDGFEGTKGEAPFIRIRSFTLKQGEGLCIEIEDNGKGIDMKNYLQICEDARHFDASNEYNRGKHIGLANIKWRLAYLLGDSQDFRISPRTPHGTIVTIKLYEDARMPDQTA